MVGKPEVLCANERRVEAQPAVNRAPLFFLPFLHSLSENGIATRQAALVFLAASPLLFVASLQVDRFGQKKRVCLPK